MPWQSISDKEIEEYKREHGYIFRYVLDGGYAYFRSITRSEAAAIGLTSGFLSGEQEEEVFKTALLYPSIREIDLDDVKAGVPTKIAGKVLEISGLAGASGLSKRYNDLKNSRTVYHTISSTICAAFQSINPYDLDDIPLMRLLELLMLAEETLLLKQLVATGQFGEIDFQQEDQAPMTDEERDKMMRAMLESGEAAGGWVDRTKRKPPNVQANNPPDTLM